MAGQFLEGPEMLPDLPARPEVEPGIGQRVDPNMPVDPQERLRNAFAMMLMQQPQGQAVPLNDLTKMRLDNMQPQPGMDLFASKSTPGDVAQTPLAKPPANTDFPMPPTFNPAFPKPQPPVLDNNNVHQAFPLAQGSRVVAPDSPDYIGKPPQSAFKLPKRPSLAEKE